MRSTNLRNKDLLLENSEQLVALLLSQYKTNQSQYQESQQSFFNRIDTIISQQQTQIRHQLAKLSTHTAIIEKQGQYILELQKQVIQLSNQIAHLSQKLLSSQENIDQSLPQAKPSVQKTKKRNNPKPTFGRRELNTEAKKYTQLKDKRGAYAKLKAQFGPDNAQKILQKSKKMNKQSKN